jgi:hypothetical protein
VVVTEGAPGPAGPAGDEGVVGSSGGVVVDVVDVELVVVVSPYSIVISVESALTSTDDRISEAATNDNMTDIRVLFMEPTFNNVRFSYKLNCRIQTETMTDYHQLSL